MLESIAGPVDRGVPSPSLQHTAFKAGEAVLGAAGCEAVRQISLTCPNIHNIPVDFSPFPGRRNADDGDASGGPVVFWATKEPFGVIKATVGRPCGVSGGGGKARL